MVNFKKTIMICSIVLALCFFLFPTTHAETLNIKGDFDEVLDNPCTGEEIELEGRFHLLIVITESASGNLNFKIQLTAHGNGYGVATSDHYQFNKKCDLHVTESQGFVLDLGVSTRLIGQGPENNAVLRFKLHLTFNANGELTAFQLVPVDIECPDTVDG